VRPHDDVHRVDLEELHPIEDAEHVASIGPRHRTPEAREALCRQRDPSRLGDAESSHQLTNSA
jgi:hypothetical protein